MVVCVSWNVASRRKVHQQMDALWSLRPDFIALQEVTRRSCRLWIRALGGCGYTHIVSNLGRTASGPRRYGLLLAARVPLRVLDLSVYDAVWSERILGVEVQGDVPWSWLTTHIPPGSSNGWVKVEILEALQRVVLGLRGSPLLVCGDFNCPQEERLDGVVTWAQRVARDGSVKMRKTIRGQESQRWDDAERVFMEASSTLGLRDAVRVCSPLPQHVFSWVLCRKGVETHRRYDHVFVGEGFDPVEARYIHMFREERLSDHAPVWVRLRRF